MPPDRVRLFQVAGGDLKRLLAQWHRRHGLTSNEFAALVAGELSLHASVQVDQDRDQDAAKRPERRRKTT